MKKHLTFITAIATMFLLSGCNLVKPTATATNTPVATPSTQPSNSPAFTSVSELIPIDTNGNKAYNLKYSYIGSGNEYASYTAYIDFSSGDKYQLRLNNGGSETVKVLQVVNGELKVVFSKSEVYYRDNFISKTNEASEVLIKEPIEVGTTWTLRDGSVRTITNIDKVINTMDTDFDCVEVTTTSKDFKTIDYYAPHFGLIQTIDTTSQISSLVSGVNSSTPLTQNVQFYYPDSTASTLKVVENTLSFNTNDATKSQFEKFFKTAPANSGKLMSSNAKINYLYLGIDGIVYIDFSKEFVSEMNAGSSYEGLILQGITNTLGNYYGVKKVYLTVAGQPYSSGHILMKKGETFKVKG